MFDLFSSSHLLILLVVLLVVVGPKDLPRLMNMAGRWAGKARAMANEFRKSFDEMARQSELDELRKEIEDLKKNNPISDIAASMNDVNASLNETVAVDGAAQPSSVMAPAAAPVEAPIPENGVEPRSGEFDVTAAPAPSEKTAP